LDFTPIFINLFVRRRHRPWVWLRNWNRFDLWPLTFWPLNGVTGHPFYGLPSCQLSACYALPFSTYGQARDRQTDRQTTAVNA